MSGSQVDRVVGDHYLVRHTLGAGKHGKVKLAVDSRDRSLCALKILNNLAALDKEIHALESLRHPNIIALKVNARDIWV